MQKRLKSDVGRRAWNILRLALIWARKGGILVLKKRLIMFDLSHFMKSLRHSHNKAAAGRGGALHYGDRQLSFDATPIIHVRMHRPNSMRFKFPHIPCINPHVAGHDFDDLSSSSYSYCEARKSFLIGGYDDHDHQDDDSDSDEYGCCVVSEHKICEEEEGIDLKAEEFIANFYEQLKLQRQVSYLEYKKNK